MRSRIVLIAVAVLLSASALLAVAILLLGGHFGETQGRILATTALLAGYGVLALPAATLIDRERAGPLATLDAVLAAAAAALAVAQIWSGGGETLGKTVGTVTVALLAVAQTAALTASERRLHALFAVSIVLAAAASATAVSLIWAGGGGDAGRVLGALVVLDLLAAALQPILLRARSADEARTTLRVHLVSGDVRELTVRGQVERVEISKSDTTGASRPG